MTILALDCGTRTGWAATTPSGGVESGVQVFDVRRGESPGMRFLRFRLWLEGVCKNIRPAVIVYEQAHHRGGAPTEIGVGLATRVLEVAAATGAEHKSVHSATLKLYATGSGAADKAAMCDAAARRFLHYAWVNADEGGDEADALMMLAWALDGFPERARAKKTRKKVAG